MKLYKVHKERMWLKLVIILFMLCLSLPVSVIASVEGVLKDIETKMSGIRTIETDFVQEKELAMFKAKIIIEGSMYIQKPKLFAWHVYKPVRYSAIINGDVMRQWDEETDQTHKISLSKNPMFSVIITQMQLWFLGAYVELLDDYSITVLQQNPLMLTFTPHENTSVASVIDKIEVVFREDESYISQIHIWEKSGDNTLVSFINTRFNVPIDPVIWKVKSYVR